MARVFVSYSSAETALTRYLHEVLVAEGHDVFLDRHLQDGIHPSQNWKNNLFERLRWADVVVGLVSDAYVTSQWCFAEIAIAQTLGRVVLPVVVAQEVRHPLLDAIQHINYAADPVAGLARLTAELRDIDAAGGGGWPDGCSPFPGLKAFEADLRQAFFGRRDENRSLAGMLRAQIDQGATQILVVVGPSGCGKSSLVRAGLLPTMAADPGWLTMPALTPAARAGGSADPVAGLAVLLATEARFVGLTWTVRDVAARLKASIGLAALVDELLVAALGRRRRLLLVVDQFEELLTQTPPDLRRHFAALLREGMLGRLAVVATLRPEFLAAVQADDSIGGLARQIIELAPLRRESLRTVVEQPCQLAGIGIDRELVDLLVADANAGEALPLLAFTLRELADGVTRGGHLSAARYHELGGVVGALAGQADLAMTAAQARTGRSRDEVISGLLRLVTVDEQDRPTRWRTPVTDLPEAVRAELDEFVRHRLLVTDTRAGIAVVAVAHEAFLTGWPPLARAIAERATALKMRPQVENAARQWSNGGHASVNLWEGNQLASAVADTGAHPMPNRIGLRRRQVIADRIELSADARTFLHACIRRERRRRTRTVTILASLLAIALVGAGAALVGQRDARHQQKLADQQRTVAVAHGLVAQAESIRGRDPRTALRLGVAARHVTDDDAARASLFKTVTSTTIAASLTGHTASVTSMAWSPDRHTLATASRDRTVLIWDFTNWDRPARIGNPLTGTADVTSVAWSPDGRTIATGSEDQTVILWDVTGHARPTRIAKPIVVSAVTDYVNSVNALVWSLDGRTLASASDDGTLILWNLTDQSRPVPLGAPLTPKPDGLMAVAWSPDGRTLAGGSFNDGLVFWDVHDPTRPRRIGTGAANSVSTAAWSPDGRILAIGTEASEDTQSETDGNASTAGSVALWDVTNPARGRPLGEPVPGHTRSVSSVAWSPDGRRLATGSWDGAMIIWDVSDRARPHRTGAALTGHTEDITTAVWAPDGHTVVSGGVDARMIIWDLADRYQPHPIGKPLQGAHLSKGAQVWSPDGRTMAGRGADGGLMLWDVGTPDRPHRIGPPPDHSDPYDGAAGWSPDGWSLAVTVDGAVVLWDVRDRDRPATLASVPTDLADPVEVIAWSPDSHALAFATTNGTVPLWDVTDRARPTRIGEPLGGQPPGGQTVAWSPDGHTLAVSSLAGAVVLWDVTDRARPSQIGGPLTERASFQTLAWSRPDGHMLAAGNAEGTVILWDAIDLTQPTRIGDPLIGNNGTIGSLAWSPDGKILATGDADAVILRDTTGLSDARDHAEERACVMADGGLTEDQWRRFAPSLPYQQTCPQAG